MKKGVALLTFATVGMLILAAFQNAIGSTNIPMPGSAGWVPGRADSHAIIERSAVGLGAPVTICDGKMLKILPAGSGEDLEVTGDCEVDGKVPNGTYLYHNVNIYTASGGQTGGVLRFDDAKIIFKAESILIENGGTLRAGTPSAPIGKQGSLEIALYGASNLATDPGITCKSPGGTCGVPATGGNDIWNSNKMMASMRRPGSCKEMQLVNGKKDCFYQYDVFDKSDVAGAYFGHKVLAVSYGGSLQLYGARGATICDPANPKSPACMADAKASNTASSWVRLDASTAPGDTALKVDRDVSDWQPGKGETVQIVLTTTDYVPAHSEVLTVKGVNGSRISVNGKVTWPHNGVRYSLAKARQGTGPDRDFIENRAAVGLLTRSIRIVSKGDGPNDSFDKVSGYFYGGHTIARQGFKAFQVQGVEFRRLGQGGSIGHYPVHFHMDRMVADGTFVKDCSINESMTRWITIHATQGALVARNVGYKSIGHGFFIEDGTEINNKLYANLGVFARSATDGPQNPLKVPGILVAPNYPNAPTDKFPYYSDANHPSVFWIMNGWNDFEYNMAAGTGTCGACYWLVPGANSGPSLYEYWGKGYAAEQYNQDRASTTPLYRFVGNSCVSAMTAFQTVQATDPCFGILNPGGGQAPSVKPLSPPGAPTPNANPDDESYYPITNGGGRFGTLCPEGKDCSNKDQVPRCENDKVQNCAVTVLDDFTSSFNWAPTNFSAIWLRSGWYLLNQSAITDVLNGGITMVTGGGYTLSDAPLGFWALSRKTAFVGNTQTCDQKKCDNPFAANSGPVNEFSAAFDTKYKTPNPMVCEKQTNGAYPGDVCFNRNFDLSLPVSGFANNQRLFNIYDGPSYEDSNAFLDINPTLIPTTDCKPQAGNGNPCANTSKYMQLQLGVTGIPQGITNPLNDKEPAIGQCYLPNAAIAWKQPNGFFYPPAFHSVNLSFDNVDIRHFVIEPQFDAKDPHNYWTDYAAVQKRYCTYTNQVLGPPVNYFAVGLFNGFTDIDRQTELNDDDGSLTGLKKTISVNEDEFFNAPVETSECASDAAVAPLSPSGTAKTSPYDYVTTVVYPDCALSAPAKAPVCSGPIWYSECTNNGCYGVPMFRESTTPMDGGQAKPIMLAGQSVFQRSSLSVNHASYYIDTSVSEAVQKAAILPTVSSALSVFQPGMKFYVFLLYAKPDTQQKYQLYVGKKFDKATQLSLVQVSPKSAPYTISDLGKVPDGWNAQLDSNGILTVNVDMSKLTKFKDQYETAKGNACQPASFCTLKTTMPDDQKKDKVSYCGCNLKDDPNDPVQHSLYLQCKDDPKTGVSPICGWAGKDVDCPEGGCYGFAVTLASDFSNAMRIPPPSVSCIKADDSNFNISFQPVSAGLAVQQCKYPSVPAGMFCK